MQQLTANCSLLVFLALLIIIYEASALIAGSRKEIQFWCKHCVVDAVGISVPVTLPWANVYIMLRQA
jgi:hypothetical protein